MQLAGLSISVVGSVEVQPSNDEVVDASWDRLFAVKSRRHTKVELETRERACGVRCEVSCILADHELRGLVRPTTARRDPMHTLFSNGVLGYELRAFLDVLKDDVGIAWRVLKTVCGSASLCWPSCRKTASLNASGVFNEWSQAHAALFPGSASDLKAMANPLRYMVEQSLPKGIDDAALGYFVALADIVAYSDVLKFGARTEHDLNELTARVSRFFFCMQPRGLCKQCLSTQTPRSLPHPRANQGHWLLY